MVVEGLIVWSLLLFMWWLLKEPFVIRSEVHLCSLSADSAGQLNVLGHNSDTLGVDGAQVGVSEKVAPSVTEKSFVITSKVSPSQPSVVLLAVAVSSESPA